MFQRAVKWVSIAGILAFVATPAHAQLVNGKWQAPAKSGGSASAPRQGVAVRHEDEGAKKPSASGTVVPLRVIHAVLMSDGSIVADFGAGLEPVRRACPSAVSNMPLRIIGSAPSQTPDPQRTPTTAQQRDASREAAKGSCHLRDQRGGVFVTR